MLAIQEEELPNLSNSDKISAVRLRPTTPMTSLFPMFIGRYRLRPVVRATSTQTQQSSKEQLLSPTTSFKKNPKTEKEQISFTKTDSGLSLTHAHETKEHFAAEYHSSLPGNTVSITPSTIDFHS